MDAPGRDTVRCSAEVVAGDCRIRYVRRGSGRPVVLLGAAELAAPLRTELSDALAARFRVLEPDAFTGESPSGEEELRRSDADGGGSPSGKTELRWLVPFLEGLGLLGVGVVVGGRFGGAASRLVIESPEHVWDVVVLDGPTVSGVRHGAAAGEGPRAHRLGDGEGPPAHVVAAGRSPMPGGPGRVLHVNAGHSDPPALLGRILEFLSHTRTSPGA